METPKERKGKPIKVHTDASYKDGVSTHNWSIRNTRKKVIKSHTFKAHEETSMKSELLTITNVIQFLEKKGWDNVIIYTDCQQLVKKFNSEESDNDIKFLKWLMKGLNIRIKWKSREDKYISKADDKCRKLMKTVFNRKEYIEG
jgi:ribonuclease HI